MATTDPRPYERRQRLSEKRVRAQDNPAKSRLTKHLRLVVIIKLKSGQGQAIEDRGRKEI